MLAVRLPLEQYVFLDVRGVGSRYSIPVAEFVSDPPENDPAHFFLRNHKHNQFCGKLLTLPRMFVQRGDVDVDLPPPPLPPPEDVEQFANLPPPMLPEEDDFDDFDEDFDDDSGPWLDASDYPPPPEPPPGQDDGYLHVSSY